MHELKHVGSEESPFEQAEHYEKEDVSHAGIPIFLI